MTADIYLGYRDNDHREAPWAHFYNPTLAPFQPQVREALLAGGMAHECFLPPEDVSALEASGYQNIETGWARTPCGGVSLACLTHMPEVTPAMWDWWFAWHGDDPLKYKLWHPQAHVHVAWRDGREGEASYINRVSHIVEYLGSDLVRGAIGFLPPSALGFDEARLKERGEVIICARIGVPGTPLRGGWLLHQLRPVSGGAEMRSRMWMGGRHSAIGDDPGVLARAAGRAMRPLSKHLLPNPAELLAHNAQEMAHLAGFLPALHAEFGSNRDSVGKTA